MKGTDGARLDPYKPVSVTFTVQDTPPEALSARAGFTEHETGQWAYRGAFGWRDFIGPDISILADNHDNRAVCLAAAFNVPVEIADPGKIVLRAEPVNGQAREFTVANGLYCSVQPGRLNDTGHILAVSIRRDALFPELAGTLEGAAWARVADLLGPANRGRITLSVLPGAVRHRGGSAVNEERVDVVIEAVNGAAETVSPAVPGVPPAEAPKKAAFTEEWRCDVSSVRGYVGFAGMAKGGDAVYVSGNGGLAAVGFDGVKKWEVAGNFGPPVVSPTDGAVAVVTSSRIAFDAYNALVLRAEYALHVYNPDGTLRWNAPLGSGAFVTTPRFTSEGGLLVVVGDRTTVSAGGRELKYVAAVLYRFAPDGRLLWATDLGPAIGDRVSHNSIALSGGRAVVAGRNGAAVVDVGTGQVISSGRFTTPNNADIGGSVTAAADNRGFYAYNGQRINEGGSLLEFDATGGFVREIRGVEPNLAVSSPGYPPVLTGDTVYVGDIALSRATGEIERVPYSVVDALDDGRLLVEKERAPHSVFSFRLAVYDPRSGQIVKEILSQDWVNGDGSSRPCEYGSLYVLTDNYLVKLSDAQQPPVPVRLEVRPAEATVRVGESQQYRAFVIYSDGSERDVTGEAAWSVSDPSIASVAQGQQGGLATGLKPGRVDVVAAWEVK